MRPFSVKNKWNGLWSVKECGGLGVWDISFAEGGVIGSQWPGIFGWLILLLEMKNDLIAHSWIADIIDNRSHPPIQPRASLLAQLWTGGNIQSGTRWILGWGILSQWRSYILMIRSGT